MGRKKSLSSMLDDCSDGVFRIVTMQNTVNPEAYKSVLVRLPEEDLKNALEILQREDRYESKQREIEIELNIRHSPDPVLHNSAWEKEFAKEWEVARQVVRRRCR